VITLHRKNVLLIVVISALFYLILISSPVNIGKAVPQNLSPQATGEPSTTPIPGTWYNAIGFPYGVFSISSPVNQTYNSNTLLLSINGQAILPSGVIFEYSLDGQQNATIEVTTPPSMSSGGNFQAKTILQQLAQGPHTIEVFGELDLSKTYYAELSVAFTINVPSSTPTLSPTSTPYMTPSPSGDTTPTPIDLPSPSPDSASPTPSQTLQPTQFPNLTPSPSTSNAPTLPTPKPYSGFLGTAMPTEHVLATASAVLIIVATVLLLKRSIDHASKSKTNPPNVESHR
jgi:hypothetical protein